MIIRTPRIILKVAGILKIRLDVYVIQYLDKDVLFDEYIYIYFFFRGGTGLHSDLDSSYNCSVMGLTVICYYIFLVTCFL